MRPLSIGAVVHVVVDVISMLVVVGAVTGVNVVLGGIGGVSSDHEMLIRSASLEPIRRDAVILMSAIAAVVSVSLVHNFSSDVAPAIIRAVASLTPLISFSMAMMMAGLSPRPSAFSSDD